MKITRFCWGVELSRAVKYLGLYGLVMSVIGVIGAVLLFALPSILGLHQDADPNLLGGLYGGAVFFLLINIGWFIFSHILVERNRNINIEGVKRMIKTGSYIIGSLQAIAFAILLINGLIFVSIGSGGMGIAGGIIMTIGGIFLIFPSLLLHGIRTNSPGKVKIWIDEQFVLVGLVLFASILGLVLFASILGLVLFASIRYGLLQMIVLCLSFMYSMGMVIVHYNIMLENDRTMNMEIAAGMDKDTSDQHGQNPLPKPTAIRRSCLSSPQNY
eukprot:GFUD01116964.1.p1 GENE.GFUD01116964.1~~GFUD01116964.1.p1  ORF type:complete len:272 (+),score=33.85 GFUD01116964.1:93-908(+)